MNSAVNNPILRRNVKQPTYAVCRLCSASSQRWQDVLNQHYYQCYQCGMIQLAAAQLPTHSTEKTCYDLHQNHANDLGYRRYLSQLSTPLSARLPAQAEGLDYGCGPTPVLANMFSESGFPSTYYDPIYFPHQQRLTQRYDFITCTETVEHFHQPAQEFRRLLALLRPGAWLAIMTQWYRTEQNFTHWHYRRDPTHVCFYREQSFIWLARHYHLRWYHPAPNVALLQRR